MTENEIRQNVVNTAISYLGYNKQDGTYKKIIDRYNTYQPLPRSYKVTYKDDWCAVFVSVISMLCGLTDIMFVECSCNVMIELYKKADRWQEADDYVPSKGDLLLYDWDDNGQGDCTGMPDHIGIVVEVSGNMMKVIEGNKGNAVAYRNIQVNGRYIRGYCLPDYGSKAQSTITNQQISKTAESNKSEKKVAYAKEKENTYAGKYLIIAKEGLNLRYKPGEISQDNLILTIPYQEQVICYGYYTTIKNVKWFLVTYNDLTGYVSSEYLKKEQV